ncbi:FAD dependent oxidoreductase [Phanerochaete sordida]|uniref:FAD dependent oxidoreductase n=1 Tax=Phanerochaete sordida TaxID=48140 RepID=A0A9P3GE30_9APHY|nr:FAD dependent oxidoreductase [Phanerochaete sordida]
MRCTTLAIALLAGFTVAGAAPNATATCLQIVTVISNTSAVFWPGTPSYNNDTHHWANSSSAESACSVEPGSAQDVGKILQILGSTMTPFAVKGGGHATNPGFSSTSGVQIAMTRFNNVTYNRTANTVDYGTGLFWEDVYKALEKDKVNVVGGRVTGVGVGGLSLGGGYSWLTNQHGLTVDNIVGFEIVLPDGKVTEVTEKDNADLFFSVMGGYNNFGIVTRITANAYPQGQVWGGVSVIEDKGRNWDDLSDATIKFQNKVTDRKAQVLPAYNVWNGKGLATVIVFYDGPIPPKGMFDDFLSIPDVGFLRNISSRSFSEFVEAIPVDEAGTPSRAVFNTVSLTDFSPTLMKAIVNETRFWAGNLTPASATFISYDIELFLPDLFTHGPANRTAYPPTRKPGLLPLNMYYSWTAEVNDTRMVDAIKESAAHIKALAVAEGQDVAHAPVYGNYAVSGTPVEDIFGAHLQRMRDTKKRIDPNNVMGLTGGWKVTV